MKLIIKPTLAACIALAGQSQAAVVTWANSGTFSDMAQLSTNGTLVEARNLGQLVNGTVNNGIATTTVGIFAGVTGIQYVPGPSGTFWSANAYQGATIVGLDATQTSDLLDSLEFYGGANNSTFNVTGLTPGQAYEVQAIISRNDAGFTMSAGYAASVGGTEVYTLAGLPTNSSAVLLTGTFTADNAVQELHFANSASNNASVNAFQLRVVPEPSGLSLLGICGVWGLLRRRRCLDENKWARPSDQ